jgi:hypothetical protein
VTFYLSTGCTNGWVTPLLFVLGNREWRHSNWSPEKRIISHPFDPRIRFNMIPSPIAAITWNDFVFGVIGNATWGFLATIFTSLYFATKNRSKFNGRWKATIRWRPEWSKSHLTENGEDLHSEGTLALSYGSGVDRDQYWGLSEWHLRQGEKNLAHLCVEIHSLKINKVAKISWPWITHTLVSAELTSRIRQQLGDFVYRKQFAIYEIRFTSSSVHRLEGLVWARQSVDDKIQVVGEFKAIHD